MSWRNQKEKLMILSFELINQQLVGTCDEYEKERQVYNLPDLFTDESDIKTIDCALPDERLDNLAGLEPLTTS